MKLNRKVSPALLKQMGFTNRIPSEWYYYKKILLDISFNLVIKFDENDYAVDYEIQVLDDNFCQHYDYQNYLTRSNPPIAAAKVKEMVEAILTKLWNADIFTEYELGEYI